MAVAVDPTILAAAAAMTSKMEAQVEEKHEVDVGAMEQKLRVKMALDEIGDDGIAGLPPYRSAHGQDIPAGRSPLLKDDHIHRFLVQARGDADKAAQALIDTLTWRQRVFPAAEPSGRPVELLNEGRRFRELGPNRDGDLVFALDFRWGHFYTEEDGPLDCLRMVLLAVERACEAADAIGRPKLVLIMFGGPPPSVWAQVCYRFLDRHYPERLKKAVVYPVPSMWASVVSACMYFLRADTRQKIDVVSEEAELVESAGLLPEQLPEEWQGGVEMVGERLKPDTVLMKSMVMEYLNPFGDSGEEAEKKMTRPW